MTHSSKVLFIFAYFVLFGVALVFVLRDSPDPITKHLPQRYKNGDFEIERSSYIDFTLCMKVSLTQDELRRFLKEMFDEPEIGIQVAVQPIEARCTAEFWPAAFNRKTIAHSATYAEGMSHPQSSQGAVYEQGTLYFWSNSM
ncbi:hypothetical protein [Fulvimarina sp. MAC3]|uniref:hypothetical protein n=1 Tax=Fulvimarina sp. MAC3 TaxID=3148887 RepID=UPI0031FDB4D8